LRTGYFTAQSDKDHAADIGVVHQTREDTEQNLDVPCSAPAASVGVGDTYRLRHLSSYFINDAVDTRHCRENKNVIANTDTSVFSYISFDVIHFFHLLLSRLCV